MSLKGDNEDLAKLAFGILNEDCGHCAEDRKEEDAENATDGPRYGAIKRVKDLIENMRETAIEYGQLGAEALSSRSYKVDEEASDALIKLDKIERDIFNLLDGIKAPRGSSEDQEDPASQVNPANPHGGPSVLSSDDKGQV